jgi:modulator of FtsH protease
MRTPTGATVVSEASLLTAAVFVSLSAYVHITKKDFSAWGGMLFTGLIVLIVASVIGLFFLSSSAYQLTLSAISAIIFSGFILFDTSRLVRGGETNYIMAALSLYLDVLNLFLDLLRLLSSDRR